MHATFSLSHLNQAYHAGSALTVSFSDRSARSACQLSAPKVMVVTGWRAIASLPAFLIIWRHRILGRAMAVDRAI
jgi:hypothetical protein